MSVINHVYRHLSLVMTSLANGHHNNIIHYHTVIGDHLVLQVEEKYLCPMDMVMCIPKQHLVVVSTCM